MAPKAINPIPRPAQKIHRPLVLLFLAAFLLILGDMFGPGGFLGT